MTSVILFVLILLFLSFLPVHDLPFLIFLSRSFCSFLFISLSRLYEAGLGFLHIQIPRLSLGD